MSKKHTPGPWIWGDDFGGLFSGSNDEAVLAYADYEGMWLSGSGAQKEANARLIAAAPDLLAALLLAYRDLNGGPDSLSATEHATAFKMARAAIAMATREGA